MKNHWLGALAGVALLGAVPAAPLDEGTRRLAHDIFQQLVEINTTDSAGSTTIAAEAMAKRLLEAGFAADDVKVLGPNDRKGNLVARLRGSGGGRQPILIIGHLDVVEARREGRRWWAAICTLGPVLLLWVLYCNVYPVPAYPSNLWPYVTFAWIASAVLVIRLRPALAAAPLPEYTPASPAPPGESGDRRWRP